MSRIAKLRTKAGATLELVAEAAAMVVSVSGATVAAVLGKFVVGIALGAVALGLLLRIKGRKQRAMSPAPQVPAWARFSIAALSVLEVGLLVEAANLPVRFDQPGFAYWHWLLLALAFLVAYLLQSGALAGVLRRRSAESAA